MKASNNYLLILLFVAVSISCTSNKDTVTPKNGKINLAITEGDSIPPKELEISCELIKNERRLTEIVDSIETIYGKAGYACRCYPDDIASTDSNKIVVQVLKDTELRYQGVAMFKYDTITNVFSYYDMKQEQK